MTQDDLSVPICLVGGELYLVSEALPSLPGVLLKRDPTPTPTPPAGPILPELRLGPGWLSRKGGPTASSAAGQAQISMCVLCV